MGLAKQCLLGLAALCTVILATPVSRAGADTDADDNELVPLIARVVRKITFQGQSQRPNLPFPSPTKGQTKDNCTCQYHVTCAYQLDKIERACELPGDIIGVCCPPVAEGSERWRTFNRAKTRYVLEHCNASQETMDDVSMDVINGACKKGINNITEIYKLKKELLSKENIVERGTPASNHFRVFRALPEARVLQRKAQEMAAASWYLATDLDIPGKNTSQIEASESDMGINCMERINCNNPGSRYRTASGECNNLNNPEWGMSRTRLWRLLCPKYEDGIYSARVNGVNTTQRPGKPLPLVRKLANIIMPDMDKPDMRNTLWVMQWAQFMDHDLSHSPFDHIEENGREEGIECCKNNFTFPEERRHPYCMPIKIPRNDTFFEQFGHTCMNFVRSMTVCPYETECRFGPAEQINTLTQWIDGSTVYGQNQNEQNILRTNRSGLLRHSCNNFLPLREDGCDARRGECYLAGESRVNEVPGLTMIHTIWMRQHNRIARRLQKLNPCWCDEDVFQETRRIIVAQITHITYNEWLPIIIGEKFMAEFGLLPRRKGFTSDYDPTINANINNEFSTAAFRFGHSLVQGLIKLFSQQDRESTEALRNNFMTGSLITRAGGFEDLLRGLARQPIQRMDNFVTQELKNHVYQTPNHTFGMDLLSLNIQRGRDHAIGTYNEARVKCNLRNASNFADLTDTINPRIVQQLSQMYADVNDIDLFVGGMAETSYWVEGGDGILGPTFRCIVGDQFARLKRADRYFYELQGQAGQFTAEQLQEIRLTSWARVICDNSCLDKIQPLAFKSFHYFNLPVPCTSKMIPEMNLQHWHDCNCDDDDADDKECDDDDEECADDENNCDDDDDDDEECDEDDDDDDDDYDDDDDCGQGQIQNKNFGRECKNF